MVCLVQVRARSPRRIGENTAPPQHAFLGYRLLPRDFPTPTGYWDVLRPAPVRLLERAVGRAPRLREPGLAQQLPVRDFRDYTGCLGGLPRVRNCSPRVDAARAPRFRHSALVVRLPSRDGSELSKCSD